MNRIITWLEGHQQACPYKSILGIDCPGCGMQRALIELLKGNFAESLFLYPALIPLMMMVAFLALHIIWKLEHGARILKYLYIINASIIIIHYFSKFI